MDIFEYATTASAVFVGNLGFLAFAWALWRLRQNDREKRDMSELPFPVLIAGAAPLILAAIPLIAMR